MKVTVNLEEMAEKLRVSLPTMRKLLKRYEAMPVIERGGLGAAWVFDAEAVIAFVQERRAEEAASNAERDDLLAQVSLPLEDVLPPEERGRSPQGRLKLAQAMRQEDELAKQRGFLIMKTEMRRALTDLWVPLNQFLQAMPATIGRRHNLPDQVVREIRSLIQQQQREFHRRATALLGAGLPPADEDEDDAAA